MYRGKRDYQLKNRIVILTDDGIATGATVIAAARWIRKEDPEFLMIAVPVAPPPSVDILRQETDAVEVILCPEGLTSVGQFYEIYQPTGDEEIRQIMAKRNH